MVESHVKLATDKLFELFYPYLSDEEKKSLMTLTAADAFDHFAYLAPVMRALLEKSRYSLFKVLI